MKIVCFNINGIRARIHQIDEVVRRHSPDIIALQEVKAENSSFPFDDLCELGYTMHTHGQKGHYGVALMSRPQPITVTTGMPTDPDDAQCRLISGTFDSNIGPVTVINGYFPQGENRSHPLKFPYKERFYRDLTNFLREHCEKNSPLLVVGDFNIAPSDLDIGIGEDNRKRWLREGKTAFLPEEREWLKTMMEWGLEDTYDHGKVSDPRFSWFDYRSRGFEREPRRGLRIDLILATARLRQLLAEDVEIDYQTRSMDRPSDHCPVVARFDVALK